MAHFMFVDESGQDHKESPYEVLAGVAIHDSALWNLICEVKLAEQAISERHIRRALSAS
jgi:hypothetical protein